MISFENPHLTFAAFMCLHHTAMGTAIFLFVVRNLQRGVPAFRTRSTAAVFAAHRQALDELFLNSRHHEIVFRTHGLQLCQFEFA